MILRHATGLGRGFEHRTELQRLPSIVDHNVQSANSAPLPRRRAEWKQPISALYIISPIPISPLSSSIHDSKNAQRILKEQKEFDQETAAVDTSINKIYR
jgi:hypothetical protein